MTVEEVLARLKSLRNDMMYAHNVKSGVGENQFGVKMADIRAMAKEIKLNPPLAKQLWGSPFLEAKLLATLLMRPKALSSEEVEQLVKSAETAHAADWLMTNVVKPHPDKESMRVRWMQSENEFSARAGWSLTTERILKSPGGLDFDALLDRIESELGSAPDLAKWTMNYALAEIGITSPAHRERALSIGEKIGAYRDFPTSKGCTSPFAPIWIREMVSRQG